MLQIFLRLGAFFWRLPLPLLISLEMTIGLMAIDPVCKMRFDDEKAMYVLVFEGETYYFCSEACCAEFQRHPEDYKRNATVEEEIERDV